MTSPPKYYTISIEPELFLSMNPELEYGDIIYCQIVIDGIARVKKYMVRKDEFNRTKIVEEIIKN